MSTETISYSLYPSDLEGADLSVTLVKSGEVESTASFDTGGAIPDQKNPAPAVGVGDEGPSPESLEVTPVHEMPFIPEMAPDGRYRYSPTVIIPPDERVRISAPSAWPWRVHGHLIIQFPNGRTYIGSGTLVNKHHVLTAGHCVYSKSDGGWAQSVQFNPAQNDTNVPHGLAFATRLVSATGWTNNADADSDFGMLILDRDIGSSVGWYGIITFGGDGQLERHRVNVSGYPGDKGGQQLWTHGDVIKRVTGERLFYDVDTTGGMSGSGVWSTWEGHQGQKVAGVHTTGSLSGNGATRISRWKFDEIVAWMQTW